MTHEPTPANGALPEAAARGFGASTPTLPPRAPPPGPRPPPRAAPPPRTAPPRSAGRLCRRGHVTGVGNCDQPATGRWSAPGATAPPGR